MIRKGSHFKIARQSRRREDESLRFRLDNILDQKKDAI